MIIYKNKINIAFFILLSIISTLVSCNFESKVSKQSTISPESTIVSESTLTPIKYNCDYWNKSIGRGSPDKPKNILVSGSELGDSGLGDLYEEKWDECFVFFDKSKQILVIEVSISWNNNYLNIVNTQKRILEIDVKNKKYIEKIVDMRGNKEIFNGLSPMFNKDLATYQIETDPVVNRTIIYLEEAANSLKKEGSEWAKFDWRERVELDSIAYENLFPGKLSKINPELTKLTKGMPYSQVRQILFTHGWKAHNDKIEEYEYDTPWYKDLVIDKGYKEYLFCSGTGLGICSFKFINDQYQTVEILTAGDPQGSIFHKISDLKTECYKYEAEETSPETRVLDFKTFGFSIKIPANLREMKNADESVTILNDGDYKALFCLENMPNAHLGRGIDNIKISKYEGAFYNNVNKKIFNNTIIAIDNQEEKLPGYPVLRIQTSKGIFEIKHERDGFIENEEDMNQEVELLTQLANDIKIY